MTSRFREELRNGKDKKQAIIDAAQASCRSIFQSALVFFCATFGVYLVCNVMLVKSICAMLARGNYQRIDYNDLSACNFIYLRRFD